MAQTPPANADPALLKPHLDKLYSRFDLRFLEPDPLAAIRHYKNPRDLESAGIFAAMFAYGRADLIQKTVTSILASMGPSPAQFCSSFQTGASKGWMKGFKYRFHTREDLVALTQGVGRVLREYGSLQEAFAASDGDGTAETVLPGVTGLARLLRRSGGEGGAFNTLVTDPSSGSASKRWMLYMRWMVRRDMVDPGPWAGMVKTSRLVIPLDTHVGRIARLLGMLGRKSNDWKAAVELTRYLRKLDPADPVRYDFAICSYGKLGYCSRKAEPEKCHECDMVRICSIASLTS
ncbi:MAG: TIGR02757 family protein [Nitrospinota bacterium]|nr:TIGR02757 family protein [Nitrospinota bacterium]MDH5756172.1 TIGR02757 family protein [Nitrospinota bacterium]